MDPIQYLRAFRRRWAVIVAAVLVAGAAGWLTTSTVAPVQAAPQRYSATALLWVGTGSTVPGVPVFDPDALVRVATLPDVVEMAAKDMGWTGDPSELAGDVQVTPDPQSDGFLDITGTASSPRQAERIAEAFSNALTTFVQQFQAQRLDRQVGIFERRIKALRRSSDPTAPQQIASLQGQIDNLTSQKQLLSGLIVIQEPRATPVVTTGFQPPSSRTTRVLIVAGIGLLAGLALALVLERFDTKIRTRQAAEQHFGYPVLAEIPVLRRKDRKGLPVANRPAGAAADAFRLLTVGVAAGPPADGDGHQTERTLERSPVPRTVLITSAGPADGKSTVAANLAAAFGEQGKQVLVLSCDLRRPSIHRRFGLPVGPGLSDAIVSANGRVDLDAWQTKARNVRLVPSGVTGANPGELLGSQWMHTALEEASAQADVVILDSSPVLVANDVTSLLAQVDSVVIVARANKTRADLAERTGEILRRAGAPVVGLAFNGTREINIPTSYRRYYKHAKEARRIANQEWGERDG